MLLECIPCEKEKTAGSLFLFEFKCQIKNNLLNGIKAVTHKKLFTKSKSKTSLNLGRTSSHFHPDYFY